RQTFAFLHSWIATHGTDGRPIIPDTKLSLLTKAAVEACDGLDGLRDGIIDDPRRCHFDPVKLLCKTGDEATCLRAAQVGAAKRIGGGVKNRRTGGQIFTGWPRGSEGFGERAGQRWRAEMMDPPLHKQSVENSAAPDKRTGAQAVKGKVARTRPRGP